MSDKATISLPWHRVQDGLEEDRLAKKGKAFGSTRRGIAYAYSDKYRKKTLRLGDLLHLDEERIRSRLHVILDSKNMELAGCYHQEPMSYEALLTGAMRRRRNSALTSVMPVPICRQPATQASALCWRHSWEPCAILITASSPIPPAPTRCRLRPLGAGIPNVRLNHVSVC